MTATPWASLADCIEVTGRSDLVQADRTLAVRTLETMTGLIEDVERADMTDRDRHWLKLAVAFQATFCHDNPDLFSRNDVTSASQDGESAAYRNPDAHILAPLARKAMRRLSWRQGTRRYDRARDRRRIDTTSEEYDDSLAWRPVRS